MRSGAEVETDLAPLQSQTRLKKLTGLRHEALEHRAATLFQERLGRARCDSLAGDGLPDRKPAATLPAAAAVALRLIQDLRTAEGGNDSPNPLRSSLCLVISYRCICVFFCIAGTAYRSDLLCGKDVKDGG